MSTADDRAAGARAAAAQQPRTGAESCAGSAHAGTARAAAAQQPRTRAESCAATARAVPATTGSPVRDALRALWPWLPTWSLASAVIAALGATVLVLGQGPTPVTVLAAAVLLGPLWAGLVATAARAVDGDDAGVRDLVRAVRTHAAAGLGVALVPAVPVAAALLAYAMWQVRPGQAWLLAPLAVAGLASVVLVPAGALAVPLLVVRGLRGRRLWVTALALTAIAPAVPVGVLALAVLAVLGGTALSASLLLLVPAPLALVTVAGYHAAAARAARLAA